MEPEDEYRFSSASNIHGYLKTLDKLGHERYADMFSTRDHAKDEFGALKIALEKSEVYQKRLIEINDALKKALPIQKFDLRRFWLERNVHDFEKVMQYLGLKPSGDNIVYSTNQREKDLSELIVESTFLTFNHNNYAAANSARFSRIFYPHIAQLGYGYHHYEKILRENADPALAMGLSIESSLWAFGFALIGAVMLGADMKLRVYKNPIEQVMFELKKRTEYIQNESVYSEVKHLI